MNRRIISIAVAAAMLCPQVAQTVSVFAADTVYSCDFSEESDIDAYSLYDSTNTDGSVSYDASMQRLCAFFGEGQDHGWDAKNGVKADVTKILENCGEDDTVKASVSFTSTYWNDPIGKASLFLEVVNESGTERVTIYEGPESTASSDETVTLSGETGEYSYLAGDKVYLCITQCSGTHYYDDISLSVEKQGASAVIDDNFDAGYTDGYTVYDGSNTEAKIDFYDGLLGVSFGDSNSWNENNGIKRDITSLVRNGQTYAASVDVNAYWGESNDTPAKLFFEVIGKGGEKNRIDIGENTGADGSTVTVSGTAALEFNEGDKVYICTSQPSGYHKYDNLTVKVYTSPVPTETAPVPTETAPVPTETAPVPTETAPVPTETAPVPTETAPAPTREPEEGELFYDDFSDGSTAGYAVYDKENTGADIAAEESLNVSFGAVPYDWNEKNGIRKDITELAETESKYSVSADVYSSYWNGVTAKVFFEIEGTDGTRRIDIAENVFETNEGTVNEGTVTVSGTADLRFGEGEKVYLCITQAAGYQSYDNIKMIYEGKADPAPIETIPAPTREPEEGELFYDDFSDGSTAGYAVYDKENTGADIAAEESLNVSFGAVPYDWNEKNGIRKDITELAETESKYSVSADVYSSYWNGVTAKVFFEIEGTDGTRRIDIAENVFETNEGTVNEGTVTVSGTADLRFGEGEKVYLCITQAAGYQSYDNIKMVYEGKADPAPIETIPAPIETDAPASTLAPIEGAIFNDDFSSEEQTESYSLYDRSNTTAGAGISMDNGELAASMGTESWNSSNGIRRDITELVKQYISGVTFGVQFSITAYWGESNDVSANVFFETIGADGRASVTEIGSVIPEAGSDTALMRGSAKLSYRDGDSIYLCITQMSGNHRYDNVAMWLENPNDEGVVPLTSGTRYTGTYFPESAKAIFKNSFAGNAASEMEAYAPYNDVAYVTAEPRDGGAFFEFPEGGASTRGVTVDITEEIDSNIPNGGDVRITCKMLPWWWWGSASVRVRSGEAVTDVETYTAKTGDPGGVWVTIGDVIRLEHAPGEKVELIITMDSSSATGITIDDVCVELPYEDVTVRDIAVSDVSKLADISKVNAVYGGEFMTETDVSWGTLENGSNVVYGTAGINGTAARAVITDSAVKIKVTPGGVETESTELEYGRAVKADGADEMVFLLDSLDSMNLISAVSGTGRYEEAVSGTSGISALMRVSDNGNGVTVEGTAPEAADNYKVIIIKNENGEPVSAAYVLLGADGEYAAEIDVLPTGRYTAVMTDTGISSDFSYATADEFEELRRKINSGSAEELLEDDTNRMILGAVTYTQLDKLSAEDKSKVYSEFKAELGDKSRSEAAALFDALVTIRAAADAVTEQEWTDMLEASADTLGLRELSIYEQYKQLNEAQRVSVKEKTYALNAEDPDEFIKAFSGAVLNTRLVNAGQYTNVQSILKQNAALFDGTGVDADNISVSAAKYINNNISSNDTTIEEIAALIERANEKASAGGGNSSGGGGGGGGGFVSGSNGVSGSNMGLSLNTPQSGASSQGNQEQSGTAADFSDLSGYEWAETAVYNLAGKRIINGYGDGTFRPGESVTREEFVKMIVSAFDIPMSGEGSTFEDVSADRWSCSYISAAAAAGIVTGISDTEFAPESNITRQDAAVIIFRVLQYKGKTLSAGELTFADSESVADYAREAVSALSENGVINGMSDGNFSPNEITSRAQAAVMIYRVADTLI